MATAADFQRAMQIDLPIGEVVSRNMQLGAELQERKKLEQEKKDLESLQYQDKVLKDTRALANTGFKTADDFMTDQTVKAQDAIVQLQKQLNRNPTALEIKAVTDPYLADLPMKHERLKMLEKNIDESLAQTSKLTSALDIPKLKQDIMNKTAYLGNNNVLAIDPEAPVRTLTELTGNPELISNYINPGKLEEEAKDWYGKTFVPELSLANTPEDLKRGTQRYVRTIPGITRFNEKALAPEIDAEPVLVGGKSYDKKNFPETYMQGLTPQAYDAYNRGQLARLDIELERKKLQGTKGFSGLPKEQQDRIAAYQSLNKYYKGIGNLKPVELDDSEYKIRQAAEQIKKNDFYKSQYLNMARQRNDREASQDDMLKFNALSSALNGDEQAAGYFVKTEDGEMDLSSISPSKGFIGLDGKPVKLYAKKGADGKMEYITVRGIKQTTNGVIKPSASAEKVKITKEQAEQIANMNRVNLPGKLTGAPIAPAIPAPKIENPEAKKFIGDMFGIADESSPFGIK